MKPTIKDIIAKATPGAYESPQEKPLIFKDSEGQNFSRGDWHTYPLAYEPGPIGIFGTQANAQLSARCNPAVMSKVVEALENSRSFILKTASEEGMTIMLDEIEQALALLNGGTP